MSETLGYELQFFLASVIWGVIILIIYDVIRIFRNIIKHNYFFIGVEDLIFWIISGLLIFRMMYIQNDGIIRGFSILGMTLGMIVYNQGISAFFVTYISKLILFVKKMIAKVIHFLLKPIGWVWKRCRWIVALFLKKGETTGNFLTKGLKKVTKRFKIEHKKNESEENEL